MKYLLMIYGSDELWASWSPEEKQGEIDRMDAFNARHKATGELLGAYGLGDGPKLVRNEGGTAVVTDGPYLETKECMASFYLLDVPNAERAIEIAADMPWSQTWPVEVWPVPHEAP